MGSAFIGRNRSQSKPKLSDIRLPTRPKVAFLTPGLGRGGAERWVISLARWLQPAFDVIGIVNSVANETKGTLQSEAARWAPVASIASDKLSAFRVLGSADIVIAWGFAALGSYLPSDLTAKVVYVAHGSGAWTADNIRAAEPMVDHWAAVSAACCDVFPERLRSEVKVVYNGADIERTTPVKGRKATRLNWGLSDDQVAVTYLGRFSTEKRSEALADAIANLPPQYVGIMAGTGWKEIEAKEHCRKVAGNRVRFVGFDSHVGDALAASDMWLNVSPSEGFSLSLIEAWLAGVPCVSTPTGAIPELQNQHGRLVTEVPIGSDGKQIADAIRNTRDSRATEAMTTRARLLAWSEFTGPAMAYRWDQYLRQISD